MERMITWNGHQTWVRIEGELGDQRPLPLVVLHGGPGMPSDYLEPVAELAHSGRAVVLYDQLGCGNSSVPDDDSLWVMQTFVDELKVLVAELQLDRFALLGHSWGGWLALEYVLEERPAGLSAIVLTSTCASLPAFALTTRALKESLPREMQTALDSHEAAGTTDSEEYNQAYMAYATRYLIRTEFPDYLLASVARHNHHIYSIMQGTEWNVTGNMKDWDVTDQLGEIDIPVLVTSGRFDEMTPELVAPMVERLPQAEWVIFEKSAHMAFIEETDHYLNTLDAFLAKADQVAAPTG